MSVLDRPLGVAAATVERPRRERRRALVGGGTLVLGSTLAWHASNFVFNSATARLLGPAGYGELAAVVAMLYLASPILVSIQTVASRRVTALVVRGELETVGGELRAYTRRLALVAVFAAAAVALGSNALARFLRVSDGRPIAILGLGLALSILTHMQRGALQGAMRFGRYAASTLTEATAKVVLAVALAWAWHDVDGPVLGVALAACCCLVVNTALLRFLPRGERTAARVESLPSGAGATVATFLLLSLLLSADVLAAKRYLPGGASGLYAAVSLSGKVVFFATSAISLYLFPAFSASRERNADGRRMLVIALAGVAACSGLIATLYFAAPEVVVRPLFGARFAAAGRYLGWIAIAFGAYAVVYLAATFLLAQRRWAGAATLAAAATLQLAGLYSFHTTIGRIVAVQVVVLGVAAVALVALSLARPPSEAAA